MNKFRILQVVLIVMFISACSAKTETAATSSNDEARRVYLEGSYNTRDFGGYKTVEGRRVRPGLLYRSDDLARLTEHDLGALERLHIKTFIDFRSNEERRNKANRLPESAVQEELLCIDAASMLRLTRVNLADGERLMMDTYRYLVTEAQPQYRQFFELISQPANLPAMFNCSAGKDRTGLASALFLSALGVDRETIYHDYMLSAKNLLGKYDQLVQENPNLLPMVTVKPEYLDAALDEIRKKYGDVESYLVDELNVDIELLKSIYLE